MLYQSIGAARLMREAFGRQAINRTQISSPIIGCGLPSKHFSDQLPLLIGLCDEIL
jgi:hypothetical protein